MTALIAEPADQACPLAPGTSHRDGQPHTLRGEKPITVRPAPRREPLFDDELPQPHLRVVGRTDQPTLPYEPWQRRLREYTPWAAPRPTGRGELPDPASFARRLIVAVLEARAGRRSLHQLTGYLSPSVRRGLAADITRRPAADGATRPVLRSVRVVEPADGVAEVAIVVQAGARFRAIAARLEGFDGRWRCVRLQIG